MWSETAFRNAGISKSSYRLIDSLSAKFPSDSFTVFANTKFETSDDWAGRKNLKVHSTVPIGRGRRALWESFGAAQAVRSGDFDVWLSTSHAVPASSRIPTVAVIHDMIPLIYPEFQDWAQSAYLKFALLHVARRADLILTNSEQTQADIVRLAGVPVSKVVIVPFGPGNLFKPSDGESNGGQELLDLPYRRFFFSLGTLEPRKNLSRLFEAFALLTEREFADIGLVIAGGKGWKEQGIFDTLDRLGIRDKVCFLGYVKDERLPVLFSGCEGFVFPSVYEGFGMPLVEAMLMGAIPLTSSEGAMGEVTQDAAIGFHPGEPREIADAMRRCARLTAQERAELKRRGSLRAQPFNWDAGAAATHQALERLVADRSVKVGAGAAS
jgi:glycosyltransferase involved in cell wall biosynthesis